MPQMPNLNPSYHLKSLKYMLNHELTNHSRELLLVLLVFLLYGKVYNKTKALRKPAKIKTSIISSFFSKQTDDGQGFT